MEDPVKEIGPIIRALTSSNSPDEQKATIERYMTPDISLHHPVVVVKPGPNSRDRVLGVFQIYRVVSPGTNVTIKSIVFDPQQNILYVEVVQRFKLFLLPGAPTPSRLVVRLNLVKKDGLYYIHSQEDFFHPEDVAALLFPIAIPFVKLYLHLGGILSNVGARVANMMGYWRPSESPSQNQSSTAPSESGLYSKED